MPDLVVSEATGERVGTLPSVDHGPDGISEAPGDQPGQAAERDGTSKTEKKISFM